MGGTAASGSPGLGPGPDRPAPPRPGLRPLRADDRAVAGTLEVVVALLIFVLVLTAYFTVVAQSFSPEERDPRPRSQAVLLGHLLVGSPGHLDDGSPNGTTAWEAFPASGRYAVTGNPNLAENLTGLGFALPGAGAGVVDRDKVEAMRKVRYEHARTLLGLDRAGLHFRLVVEEVGGTVVLDHGPRPSGGEVHVATRVVALRQVDRTPVPVDFPFPDKLVINEVMWHPYELETGEEERPLEWIELWNPNDHPVDVAGWHITGSTPTSSDNTQPSPENELVPGPGGTTTVIPADGYALVTGRVTEVYDFFEVPETTVRLRFVGGAEDDWDFVTKAGLKGDGARAKSEPGETLTLYDDRDRVVERVAYEWHWGGLNPKNTDNNYTLSRVDPYSDANDNSSWGDSQADPGDPAAGPGGGGTPGAPNRRTDPRFERSQAVLTLQVFRSPRPFETLVVNEVMYQPDGPEPDLEYVELYNPTDAAIDLDGWTLADGAEREVLTGLTDRRGATEGIVPGRGHALVVGQGKDDEVAAHYTVRRGAATVWVEVDDPVLGDGLSNSGESLTLRDADGHLAETIVYAPESGADGTGESLERVDPLAGWTGANVLVSSTADRLRGTPGRLNSWSEP